MTRSDIGRRGPRPSRRSGSIRPPAAEAEAAWVPALALVAASKKKDQAKRFLDWTLSDKAVSEYYNWKEIVTVTGGAS